MRKPALLAAVVVVLGCGTAASAQAAPTFHPRVGGALGLVPAFGQQFDVATGTLTPPVYHGGSVMTGGVTVHVLYWSPAGSTAFGGTAAGSYEALINQFFSDVQADSGKNTNLFSVLTQYGEGTSAGAITPGDYNIGYAGGVNDTDPYPATDQCASPDNIPTCITDGQIQTEIDSWITSHGGSRGLHNIWYVFLPPNVDECIDAGECGTNAFAAYHSDFDINGNGVTIYGVVVDPIIEATIGQGGDPEGNPYAEGSIDSVAHETVEAMTDPQGVGWMDSNGFEVADKCEFGPQLGTPLGTAADGSPYNELINAHQYLIQEMYSIDDGGCVQNTTQTAVADHLPLPQVNLQQFSSTISGNIGSNTMNDQVQVQLWRGDAALGAQIRVISVPATTNALGGWTASIAPYAVGDDRDELIISYSGANAPTRETILTGNGDNPFTESGWTGWFDLDNGYDVTAANAPPSITLGPCFQTGVLGLAVGGVQQESPTDFCNTQTDNATQDPAVGPGTLVTMDSNDNRAYAQGDDDVLPAITANTAGALVDLKVNLGEPDAFSLFTSPDPFLTNTGFPTCLADLEFVAVQCTGLVPDQQYTLTDSRTNEQVQETADDGTGGLPPGVLVAPFSSIKGNDVISVSNGSRTVTGIAVAPIVAKINGDSDVLAAGSKCEGGYWYGPSLSQAPLSSSAGSLDGAALTSNVCPLNGDASGLPDDDISQTDDHSGGATETEVADVDDTSPLEGETVYGAFTALAVPTIPDPNGGADADPNPASTVSVSITPLGSSTVVFSAANVDALTNAAGATVSGLAAGQYIATWTWTNSNGDARTVETRFVQAPAVQGPAGNAGPNGTNGTNGTNGATGPQGPSGAGGASGPTGPAGAKGPKGAHGPAGPLAKVTCKLKSHRKITCKVTIAKTRKGTLLLSLSRGLRVAALGHAALAGGRASLTMRELTRVSGGTWTATLVVSQPHAKPTTTSASVHIG